MFDSGDVLVRPLRGTWWPHFGFHEIVLAHGLTDLPWERLPAALEQGMTYLEAHHHVVTDADERQRFRECFAIMLPTLGVTRPSDALLQALAHAAVDEMHVEPFPDVAPALARFRQRSLRLGIVSNAWPSLARKLQILGLLRYFDSCTISAVLGYRKPDERVYMNALQQIGLPPKAVVFVDDVPSYVTAAVELGMRGVVIARYGRRPANDLLVVESLDELELLVFGDI